LISWRDVDPLTQRVEKCDTGYVAVVHATGARLLVSIPQEEESQAAYRLDRLVSRAERLLAYHARLSQRLSRANRRRQG